MRWESGRRSSNVEDRRGMSVGRGAGIAGLGGGGLLLVLLVSLCTGRNPLELLGTEETSSMAGAERGQTTPESDRQAEFVSVVLADTEDTWTPIFEAAGRTYHDPTLVLFTDEVRSACGMSSSAVGPFYCPSDQKLYIDLGFYRDLEKELGAPGDFAQAYVIAHEVGHHVQNELGISDKVRALRSRASEEQSNALSVLLELQADCFAGVWAHNAQKARNVLDQGDLEEALNAASQIGDDRLQKRAQGYVVPESFTHGTAAQRKKWFQRGFEVGSLDACDTFQSAEP
jgi:predicted metalloprotease